MLLRFKFLIYVTILVSLTTSLYAQGEYTSWIVGDTSDAVVEGFQPGLVLAGGAGDNDQAMQWMLERAAGGDVLVLRASGSDGYNNYFFSQLGVAVNSVETIRFDGPGAAFDDYVLRRIEEAEVLFLAGGDQYVYYQYWQGTPVADKINDLINVKQVTVGGTSAGMMVLSDAYYAPSASGVTSGQALNNPFHPNMNIIGKGDFIQAPLLANTITDTHFDQRNRAGRIMTFLARLVQQEATVQYGIASNEFVAVCVDEEGIARVFGEYPSFQEDVAYFLQADCLEPFMPEVCEPDTPLHWYLDGYAVWAMVIPGNINGEFTFDLNDFKTHTGGSWERWYVENGQLTQMPTGEMPVCTFLSGYLKSFEVAAVKHNIVHATWLFDPESQYDALVLEYSHDGHRWLSAETMDFDIELFKHPYTYKHHVQAVDGDLYYRLKMKGEDGQVDMSPIRHLSVSHDQSSLKIFPNPTQSHISVELPDGISRDIITIYNMMGKLMTSYHITDSSLIELDISHLAPGTYIIRSTHATPSRLIVLSP